LAVLKRSLKHSLKRQLDRAHHDSLRHPRLPAVAQYFLDCRLLPTISTDNAQEWIRVPNSRLIELVHLESHPPRSDLDQPTLLGTQSLPIIDQRPSLA
jgi:hypothetical protein